MTNPHPTLYEGKTKAFLKKIRNDTRVSALSTLIQDSA
jgi:hypothetical protein